MCPSTWTTWGAVARNADFRTVGIRGTTVNTLKMLALDVTLVRTEIKGYVGNKVYCGGGGGMLLLVVMVVLATASAVVVMLLMLLLLQLHRLLQQQQW